MRRALVSHWVGKNMLDKKILFVQSLGKSLYNHSNHNNSQQLSTTPISNQLLVAAFVRRLSHRPRQSHTLPLLKSIRVSSRLFFCLKQALLSLPSIQFNVTFQCTRVNFFSLEQFGDIPLSVIVPTCEDILDPLFTT
ncbi:hypothetical protein RCL1_000840 [Eukaryota sp. TZLM3-RCL]